MALKAVIKTFWSNTLLQSIQLTFLRFSPQNAAN